MAGTKTDYSSYILPVGLIFIAATAAQKFGLIPSKESQAAEQGAQELAELDALKPGFVKAWIKKNGTAGARYKIALLTTPKIEALAAQVKKSKGIFNDDETALYSVFRYLKTKTQVSQLAEVFERIYSRDLYSYLQSFLNESELSKVYNTIKNLPTGINL